MKALAVRCSTIGLLAGLCGVHGASAGGTVSPSVSTAHVEIVATTSVQTAVPGTGFTLTLEITPRAGIRVYAPGATGYKAVTLTLEPQSFVRSQPVKYDASELYFFKELNELVPVYQKPFAVRQDVVIQATTQAQAALRGKDSVKLTGVLDYQACNDTVCFIPVSVPVSWTLAIRPLVKPQGAPRREQ
jgi:hypothetical protein